MRFTIATDDPLSSTLVTMSGELTDFYNAQDQWVRPSDIKHALFQRMSEIVDVPVDVRVPFDETKQM